MLDWLDDLFGNFVDTLDNHPEHIAKWLVFFTLYGGPLLLGATCGWLYGLAVFIVWSLSIIAIVMVPFSRAIKKRANPAQERIQHLRKCVVDDLCPLKDSKFHVFQDRIEWAVLRHFQNWSGLILTMLFIRGWLNTMLIFPLFPKRQETRA